MKEDVLHGIAVRPDAVDITTMRQVKNRWEEKGTESVERSAAPDVGDAEEIHPLLHDLSPTADTLEGACTVALPAQQVLLRVVDLPTPDPDEVEGMIELQVDKFSPFPVEHLIVSYEQLEATDRSTRVLIAAVQRQRVEELGDVFHELGTELRRIDVDVLGWWRLLADEAGDRADGVQVTILTQSDDTLLVVSQDGIPMLLRSLGNSTADGRDEYLEAVAEEIDYTLTSVEAEWGLTTAPQLTVWHDEKDASDLISRLSQALSVRAVPRPLSSLPPLSVGLARRASDETQGGAVNLAPPEWQMARETRKWRKNLIIASSALLAVWLIVVGAFMGVLAVRRAGLAGLRSQADALKTPAEEVIQIQEKIEFIEQYEDRSRSGLELLRAVTLALPSNVDLTAFIYKKNAKLTLRGEADREPPVFDFYQNLQDDPLFGEVTAGKVQIQSRSGVSRATFSVNANLGAEEETP